MRFSIIAAVCGVLTGVVASHTPNAKRHVVHERRERLPTNWRRSAELHGSTLLPLRIALTQRNLDKAHEFLMDVSHPESPNFGNHWTPKQVAEAFAPTDDAVSSVLDWLAETGISPDRVRQSQGLNWLHAEVTVEEAENLLRTKYYRYIHARTGQAHVACEEYSIPEQIQQHVDFITPTVHFDAKIAPQKKRRAMNENEIQIAKRQISAVNHEAESRKKRSLGSPGSWSQPKADVDTPPVEPWTGLKDCDVSIVPECLRALYYLPTEFISHPNNSYGIVEYTPQAYLPSDLDMFFRNFSPPLVGQRPILESIDGGFLQTTNESFGYNSESNLDIEYAMALVYPQQVTVYQTGDDVEGASFNNFLDALDASYCTYEGGDDPNNDGIYPDPLGGGYEGPEDCGTLRAANVISTSYGFNEVDLTPFYAERQCHEYLKLGLQGTTFVFSSGDYGVAGQGGLCIDPTTGKTGSNSTCSMFNPSFPATCPYVTAVGATQVKPNASVTQPEKAAESYIYSGGGFSNVFSTPGYQASALKTYFAHHKPPYGPDRYNTTEKSRGYPDVSANGVNYVVSVDGTFNHVYGTSASAPTFGSIVTLINAARMYVGKGPVGFMNPALYANPGMMNDIVSGGNQGCGTPGFKAVDGWDPVTGLGTPNFPKMLGYFLTLP